MSDLDSRFSTTTAVNGFVGGRYGGRAVSLIAANADPTICLALTIRTPIPAGTLGFAFQLNPDDAVTVFVIQFNAPSGAASFSVVLGANGSVAIWSGSYISNTTTLLGGTPPMAFTPRKWAYCGIQAKFDSKVGSVLVHIDGAPVLSLTSINTCADTTGLAAVIQWQVSDLTNTSSVYLDDMYLCDATGLPPYNGFLGVCCIQTFSPSNDAASAQFTPSNASGQNWQMVSEHAMDGDTTYNGTSLTTASDTFEAAFNLPPTTQVLAVEPQVAVRIDDDITKNIETLLLVGAVSITGMQTPASAQYGYVSDIYVQNPVTHTAWTAKAVNALQFGYAVGATPTEP